MEARERKAGIAAGRQETHDAPDFVSGTIESRRPLPAGYAVDGGIRDGPLTSSILDNRKTDQPNGKLRNERTDGENVDEDLPEDYGDLDEVIAPPPVQNLDDADIYPTRSLEESHTEERRYEEEERRQTAARHQSELPSKSRFEAEIGTVGYLIIFSIFGTLARLGLQAITFYPDAPVVFPVLWANVAGCLIMGFLSEDRMLFRRICPTHKDFSPLAKEDSNFIEAKHDIDYAAARKAHNASKKVTPLYIGLATGLCGSFTSFSSFIRDVYLALSNRLPTPLNHPADNASMEIKTLTVPRKGGYSFMALLAVLVLTLSLSISALIFGAHLAIGLEKITPRLPSGKAKIVLDRVAPFFASGLWLGAIFLSIWPPDRNSGDLEIWRGRATFALVFAPLGVLTRFYVSLWLNSRIASFPLGTFACNIFGTIVLGMCWDLQHVRLGAVVGCQVLQGIMDGYCGCLTTVSTWVSELAVLRRRHAYRYGTVSVLVALGFLVVIMGSLQWTRGFDEIACKT